VNALTAADSVLMPIQCEYYALEGLGQLLETFNLVKRRLNPLLEVEGIVLTMADMRTNLSQQVIKEVRGHFGKRVFNTVIPRNIKLSEAPGFGKPIIEYDIRSVGAESYMEFAREFIDRNEGTL
jgi:chromosome partitioning protein